MSIHSRLVGRSPTLPINERELTVLRLLGRMGVMRGATLHDLVTPDLHVRSGERLWQRMTERKLIWQAAIPNGHTDAVGHPRGGPSHVYGLTDDGRAFIDSLGAEPHDGTFERLIYRPKQSPNAPSIPNLTHETYISDWCASLLDHIRRLPHLAGVHIQRRYAVTDASGATVQTLGVAIVLAFDPKQATFQRVPWAIPWLSAGVIERHWIITRLAVEVDGGLTAIRTLFDLAQRYAVHTKAGVYGAVPLGGTPKPVIITLPGPRWQEVAHTWAFAWPDSSAILTSTAKSLHPDYGVLWGEYISLARSPFKLTTLLGNSIGPIDKWPGLTRDWTTKKAG